MVPATVLWWAVRAGLPPAFLALASGLGPALLLLLTLLAGWFGPTFLLLLECGHLLGVSGNRCDGGAGHVDVLGGFVDRVRQPQGVLEVPPAEPVVGHRCSDYRRQLLSPHPADDAFGATTIQIRVCWADSVDQ